MLFVIFIACESVIFLTYIVLSYRERTKLAEMLASKSYADYKYFENNEYSPATEHKNMFSSRDRKKKNEELE